MLTLAVVDDADVSVGFARLPSELTVARVGSVVAATERVVVVVAVAITDTRSFVVLVQFTVSARRTPYTLAWRTYTTRHKT